MSYIKPFQGQLFYVRNLDDPQQYLKFLDLALQRLSKFLQTDQPVLWGSRDGLGGIQLSSQKGRSIPGSLNFSCTNGIPISTFSSTECLSEVSSVLCT